MSFSVFRPGQPLHNLSMALSVAATRSNSITVSVELHVRPRARKPSLLISRPVISDRPEYLAANADNTAFPELSKF